MSDILISNNNLVYSELQEDEVSLNCKLILCDFGINGNNVMLNRKTIDTWLDTLISQPVVAAITVNDDGNCDFSGHNVVKIHRVDENGNVYEDTKFDTSAIGTFNSVSIEKINGKEYIVANAKIWKRFADFCALIKKRMSEGTISTSWEISVDSSHMEIIGGQKIKVIDKGNFMGHALLNQSIAPAYESSKFLAVASNNDDDNELIEAIKRDFSISNITNKNENEEVANLENTIKETVEETSTVAPVIAEEITANVEPIVQETPVIAEVEKITEVSALTEFDLRKALRQAIAEKLNVDRWDFYLIYHFPVEKIVWTQGWNPESELDVTVFSYTVENDVVTVSEPTETKLTVSIAQINTTVAELNSKVEALTDSLVEASTKIQTLNKNVAELTPYKDSFEQAEQVRIEAETATKRELLKKFAIDSKFISETEISSDESIKICIDNVDEKGIKAIIAERFVKSLDVKNETPTIKSVETSSVIETVIPKADIADSDIEISNKNIMKQFLKR